MTLQHAKHLSVFINRRLTANRQPGDTIKTVHPQWIIDAEKDWQKHNPVQPVAPVVAIRRETTTD